MLSDFTYRIRALFRRSTTEAEMNDELQFHFEQEIHKYKRSGLPHQEVLRCARLRFGGIDQAKEECREARGVSLVETTIQDLRYGLRQLQRSFGFTIAAVFALGLGIGVNTAIFTAYNSMVARPLDAFHPREMVNLSLAHRSGAPSFTFSYPDYEAYRDSVRSFMGVIAFNAEHLRFFTFIQIRRQKAYTRGCFCRLTQLFPRTRRSADAGPRFRCRWLSRILDGHQ